jgi:hypothetical protein
MPPEDFLRSLSISRAFYRVIREQAGKWGAEALNVTAPPIGVRAEKSHSEWANFVYIAFAGTGASIDLYQMSIAGVARYAKKRDISGLSLSPVLRIHLSLFELVRLLTEGYTLKDQILRDAPEEVRKLADEAVEETVDQP